MDECCKTCKYCCEVLKYPTHQEVLTHVCVFSILQEGFDYIFEVAEYDVCECYAKK